jgi:thiamine-phosphate pyrophosphorylase
MTRPPRTGPDGPTEPAPPSDAPRGRAEAPAGRVLVLTDRRQAAAAGHDLLTVVDAAAEGGAGSVLFREKDLAGPERLALGRAVADVLADRATRLIVASDPVLARRLAAAGVHLAQADPGGDPSDHRDLIVGRSCHDRAEVAGAVSEGADYVTVSPLFPSVSKPGHGPALGPDGAASLAPTGDDAPVVYGLGGVTVDNAAGCRRAGLDGVAVMGPVMRSGDPGRTVRELVAAVAPRAEAAR